MTKNMATRILTGVGLIGVVAFALYMGGWVFSVLWVAAVSFAMAEVFHAFAQAGHRPVAWPSWVCLIISIPSFMLLTEATSLVLLVVTMFLTFLVVAFVVMFRRDPKLVDMLVSLLPLFSVVLPGICMLGLLRTTPNIKQNLLMTAAFIIPVLGDAGAYFVGVKLGSVKLNPAISPKKTLEGAVGGLVCSTLGAMAVYLVGLSFSSDLPPWWHFALLGFFGGVIGQLGDLFASMIKRHSNIKDFGHVFPGHGGMMDRLDSIFFVTVFVYLYQVAW
ncbi:MAG: phosphatidate cytidylyltransferase [Eubacteriales bacterium]|nr:phosphatidate cytidylyltransferase [Eubacteriales bacterium]MDD4104707.1 phosphatidate cytidylyltransferase [Eubacteriales bacterium]MDD4710287.1 phosphatidate cytidylyltransferase [Eubacteriales bacterium]NLO15278.1 phosphatidate cytidylyltransferase [Clostridiales bacterium]